VLLYSVYVFMVVPLFLQRIKEIFFLFLATINSFHIFQKGKYNNYSRVYIGVLLAHTIGLC
jgi:hypothetical protein